MVLDVTASTREGKKIFETSRAYIPQSTDSRSTQMVLGAANKLGLIRDTSIQPFSSKEETIEIPLPDGLRNAVIEVNLTYRLRPENIYPIHKVVKNVSLEQTR